MKSDKLPFKNTCRSENSSWSFTAITASNLKSGSKSNTDGNRTAVAITSTAAFLPASEEAESDWTYDKEY